MSISLTLLGGVLLCGCGGSVVPAVPQDPGSPPAHAVRVRTVEPAPAAPVTTDPVPETALASAPKTEVCEALEERCYRPVTLAELAARTAAPGRVVLTAVPARHVGCRPCPTGHRCQPCGETEVFVEEAQSTAKAPELALFSGSLPKASYRLFLCLEEGYWQHVSGHPSDPRTQAIHLERAIIVSELPQHPEYRLSERPLGQRESCRRTY